MFSILRAIYARLWPVLVGAPFILMVPATGEAVQHLVELRLGMFTIGDGLSPGPETVLRLSFGVLKAVTMVAGIIMTMRFCLRREERLGPIMDDWRKRSPGAWAKRLSRFDLETIVGLAGAVIPAFAAHYGLNYLAVGRPLAETVAVLALDSLVVGVLAILLGSALHVICLDPRAA